MIYHNIYLMFYLLVRKDKNLSKAARIKFLIEMVFFFLSCSVMFIFYGIFNIRTDNLIVISVLLFVSLSTSYWVSGLAVKNQSNYIKASKSFSKRTKLSYAIAGAITILISFSLVIFSAIFMSFLWKHN